MRERAADFRSEIPRGYRASAGDSAEAPRLSLRFADLCSVEASFVLFLFAGRYKDLPPLRGFPIDYTVLFLVVTWWLTALALMSRKLKAPPLRFALVAMTAFSALAAVSLFWSSMDSLNVDKCLRFLLFTSTGFLVAYMLAPEKARRSRLLRLVLWFSCAILVYYAYYRFLRGVNLADKEGPEYADNYLEYGSHAQLMFIICLSAVTLGARTQAFATAIGSIVALFALAIIGGRGPFLFALLSVPLLMIGLVWRGGRPLPHLMRLFLFIAASTCIALLARSAIGDWQSASSEGEQLTTLQRFDLQLSGEQTGSMDERLEGRQHAIEAWLEKPIFGWGIGEFRVQDSYLQYPHNLLLEILMEIGLVGASFFFLTCAAAIVDCVRATRASVVSWVEAAIILMFLTELVSHLTVQGYLGDDRAFFSYMGMAIGVGTDIIRHREFAPPRGPAMVQWR